ncbi:MAG: hypothetical protein PHC68_17670 [Syntrophorhabdaceae bacterium]|nr:hypothetical protein [Syntrophorhabdaceae bacterium]
METKTIVDGKVVSEEISTEQQSSIKITRNAKGEQTYEVKVYCDDPKELNDKLETFLKIAKEKIGV